MIGGLLGCRPMDGWAWLCRLINGASLWGSGRIGRLSLRSRLLIVLTRGGRFSCCLWLLE